MAVTTTLYYKIDSYIGDDGTVYGVRLRNNKPSPDLENWDSWYITASNPPWHSNKSRIINFDIQTPLSPSYCANWFRDCWSLTTIQGLDKLDTSNVYNMSHMFDGCLKLQSIDVSGFDTSNVEWMDYMFNACYVITSLDLSEFNTSNVTNMSHMFDGCFEITSLDLSEFDTSKVTNMSYMFYRCTKLRSIDVSSFNTSNVTTMAYMFNTCRVLTSLDVLGFNTSNVTDMQYMFYDCLALTSLDVSEFNTSKVTNMSYMFYGCQSLTTLDVSGFNTSNVTDMSSMFYNCSSLTTLDVSEFNTSNVTAMSYMFYKCSSLTTLDVSGFNTPKVTTMGFMFYDCSSLTTLDVSGFDTSEVSVMAQMFRGCSSLTTLDLSEFDTSEVSVMSNMFNNCQSLTTLDLSGFDTSNVTAMTYMFSGCQALTTLDVTGFNTSKVTFMSGMFDNCQSLTTLDLSGFDISKVTNMGYMFRNCSALYIIYFPLSSVPVSGTGSMFNNDQYQHFLIKKSSTTTAVETFWRNIASEYSNVHYEFDDNLLPSLSNFSLTRVASNGSRNYAESGGYVYLKTEVSVYTNAIPSGYTNSVKSWNLLVDGVAPQTPPLWTETSPVTTPPTMEAWYNINNTTLNHTFELTVSDSIKLNGVEKSSKTSMPLSIILQKAYALFDIMHDETNNVEGLAIGGYASLSGTLEVGLPSVFYEDVNCEDDLLIDGDATFNSNVVVTNLVGEIKMWAGNTIPTGWLECNGSEVLIEDYPLLAAALGADHPDPSDPDYISPTWGAPSVYTKFKLPNLKGRVPVGYDSSQTEFNTIGKQDGGKTHTHSTGNCTLNETQIPNHSHFNNIDATDKSSWTGREYVGYDENLFSDSSYKWRGGGHYKISVPQTRGTGGGQAHNHGATGSGSNIQPYAVVKYIICAV